MSPTLRRLASDHVSLRRSDLPPNYLFPSAQDGRVFPDDLTQLTILLTGAQGTPYSQGLWQLHLRMPTDYPTNPPKATFKTRMWHPNVEESTGAVCLETLKRDWDPKLTLKDILVTISCLLIHPNPDSALNSAAGSLLQEDYEAFAEQARIMTSIHARIPATLRQAVDAARRRGEEDHLSVPADNEAPAPASRTTSRMGATLLRKQFASIHSRPPPLPLLPTAAADESHDVSDEEEDHDPSKENDPSQSPSPVIQSPRSPRKHVLGKRPLSELPTPTDPDEGMTESEKNVAVNHFSQNTTSIPADRPKKSPRVAVTLTGANASGRLRDEASEASCTMNSSTISITPIAEDEKENVERESGEHSSEITKIPIREASTSSAATLRHTLRKVTNVSSSKGKQQPRVGIRRL